MLIVTPWHIVIGEPWQGLRVPCLIAPYLSFASRVRRRHEKKGDLNSYYQEGRTMEQTTTDTHVLRILSNQMADAVERVSPSLLQVNGRQRQPASGLVYAQDLVLTADHVLEREEDLTIQTHDARTLPAQFVGRDPATDLAVLRVADLKLDAAAAAKEAARVGSLVLAVDPSSNSRRPASCPICDRPPRSL